MKTLMILVAAFLVAGCATPQARPSGPIVREFVFDAPFDKVWAAILERATDRSWPIKTIDKSSGIIASDFMSLGNGLAGWNIAKSIAYEPSCFLCTWTGGVRQTATVFATKLEESKTRVKVGIHVEVFEDNVSHRWGAWQSNGANEKVIAEYLSQKLNVPAQIAADTSEPKGI